MESWLIQITNYLLAQSWQIAVLTIAVAIVSFLLRNRSSHVRYLLWLIVLAKCLMPPLYSIPVAVLPQQELHEYIPASPIDEGKITEYKIPEAAVTEPAGPASVRSEAAASPRATDRPVRYHTRAWLAIGWLVGVVVLLLYYLLNALRTQVWLQRQRKVLPNEFTRNIESLFKAYGVKHMPHIWLLERINQPFVWGLIRGGIYLPTRLWHGHLGRDFSHGLEARATFQASLLGHELSHVIRFDAMINSLQVITQTVFWFHPFVWWANRKIRVEREKCCDEMTIARLNALPEDYGEAIVETLAAKYEQARPVPSLAVAGQIKNIEERIKTMLKPGKKFYKQPSLIAATTVLLAAFLMVPTALVLTARAQTEAPKLQVKSTHPLHEAALTGDINKVRSLLSKGADVNEKDPGGKTALHCASEEGHAEVARLLISQGARVNATNTVEALTPLHYAARRGSKQTVELLLSKGADVNAKSREGRTPLLEAMASPSSDCRDVVELLVARGAKAPALHLAAYLGDIERVEKCLQEDNNINLRADDGSTALHASVCSDRKDIVEFLISKGANVDAKDAHCVTPLYYAATHKYEDIADLLLANGADVDAKNKDGYYTLLYYAMWDHSKDAIKLLISKGANVNAKDDAGYTPLVYAIWENDKDMVELLIGKGADVNTEDNEGLTPYYWAFMEGRKDLVELLTSKGATPVFAIHLAAREGDLARVKRFIEEGADVNIRDKGAETPLYAAVLADNNDVAKFLIDKGADVNVKDSVGRTPLESVILSCGRKDMVELLIAKGANVNAKDKWGVTPLHAACVRGQTDVAELLIAKGADLNAKITGGEVGFTPLHYACSLGHKNVAELLVTNGADLNAKDNNNQTPLHEACSNGRKEVVELLITKGADLNARDSKEQTPLSLAKAQGHEEIVELLRKHGAEE
jgi:ankyrin repeat protein/beta-lactamase regulating signal transducer with metallopeptidase domain